MPADTAERDFYDVLGIARTATADEIKKAYRKRAMESHPDRNPGDAEAEVRFKEAAEAYEVLSDPDKRARYDRFGRAGLGGAAGGPQGGFTDISDIFSAFSDIFGGESRFEDVFGRRPGQRRGQGRPGTDLRVRLALTLEEVAEAGRLGDLGVAVEAMTCAFSAEGTATVEMEMVQDLDPMTMERTFPYDTEDGRIMVEGDEPVRYQILEDGRLEMVTGDGLVVRLVRTRS